MLKGNNNNWRKNIRKNENRLKKYLTKLDKYGDKIISNNCIKRDTCK